MHVIVPSSMLESGPYLEIHSGSKYQTPYAEHEAKQRGGKHERTIIMHNVLSLTKVMKSHHGHTYIHACIHIYDTYIHICILFFCVWVGFNVWGRIAKAK